MSTQAIPLSAEDRAILDLESATVAGHTCKVIVVTAPAPSLDRLRELADSRIEAAPPLRRMLGGDPDAPAWVPDPDFDLSRHLTAIDGGPIAADELAARVAEVFERRLPRDRPLWQIEVARLDDGRSALIWRLHHALADGTASMRFAGTLLWDEEAAAGAAGESAPRTGAAHAVDDERRRGHLAAFLRREFRAAAHRSPFDGEIATRRRVALATVPLAPLHDAAKALDGATVNDAVLAIVAGGLRRWIERHHGTLGPVRLRVPVSLHSEGDDAGNRDSYFTLPVPLGEADPVARLRLIHEATVMRKREHDAEHLERFLADLGRASPRLERLAERIEAGSRSFALAVSNVPGPRGAISILGSPVESVHSLAEIGRDHALRVAVVSAGGGLFLGFTADPAIVDDVAAIARGVEDEAAELIAAAD